MSTYRDFVVSLAPQNYWRLGESSGTTAFDEMNNNNATYTSADGLGQPGALANDPATSYLCSRDSKRNVVSPVYPSSSTMSAAAWTYQTDNTTIIQPIMDCTRNCCGTYHGWSLSLNLYDNRPACWLWNGSTTARVLFGTSIANPLPLNTWHFFAMTYDGAVSKLYLNGRLSASSTAENQLTGDPSSFPLKLGCMGYDTNYQIVNGRIQECAWWTTALSASQISEMYRIGSEVNPFLRTSHMSVLF